MMKTRLSIIAIVLSTAALLGFGMVGSERHGSLFQLEVSEAAAKQPSTLVGFRSCRGLGTYLWKHRGQDTGYPYPGSFDEAGSGAEGAPSAPPSATGTNVQEAGIDEPDTVKSADSAILALAEGDLHAVVTGPGGPRLVDSLDLSEEAPYPGGVATDAPEIAYSGGPTSILVDGDLALIVGYGWREQGPITTLTEVDISDPSAMQIVKTIEAEGSFVSARQIGSTARLVISAYPDFVELKAQRRTSRRWLPSLTVRDGDSSATSRQPLSSCREVDRSERYSGSGLLTVLTVDLEDGAEILDSDAIMTAGDTVYASTDRMYVATQRWGSDDAAPERSSTVGTQIHAFSTTEPRQTEYLASGRVPGWMLSQWSMSERNGFLRVASTTSPPWQGDEPTAKSESFVTVLAERDGELVQVGQLGGLGIDEQIYAVRFFDDVGYVVTFRQVDPLYTLDLSDPSAPKLVGELKIPGYSAYLHPVGEGLLLGVGQDANSEGVTEGTQLSLFDVSDPSAPTRIATHKLGRHAYSEVEWDHHAFFFDPETGVSITPITDWAANESETFYGAVGVQVSPAGLTEVARLQHGSGWRATITRSLSRAGSVYTVSPKGIMQHDPRTLESSGFASFPVAATPPTPAAANP